MFFYQLICHWVRSPLAKTGGGLGEDFLSEGASAWVGSERGVLPGQCSLCGCGGHPIGAHMPDRTMLLATIASLLSASASFKRRIFITRRHRFAQRWRDRWRLCCLVMEHQRWR